MNQNKQSVVIGGVVVGLIALIIIFASFYFPRQTEQGVERPREERQEFQGEEPNKDISGNTEEETIASDGASQGKENGNVGIGTLTPLEKLTVRGVIQSIEGGFKFPDGTIQKSAATRQDSLWIQTNTNIYRLQGKIGIGTADPSALLDVAGTIHALDILCADCLGASVLGVDAITPSELAPTSVQPGTYGDESHVPQITIDGDGRITSAADVSTSSSPTKSSKAGSVMYLKRAQASLTEEPVKCPANWLEADLQKELVSNGYKNMVRTCYRTDEACQVMYLKREQVSVIEDPAKCPSGWEQADLQSEHVGHGYKNTMRTCYRCP